MYSRIIKALDESIAEHNNKKLQKLLSQSTAASGEIEQNDDHPHIDDLDTNEVIQHGFLLLTNAIASNNLIAVRLLLAYSADEMISEEGFEALCNLSKDKHPKINGLLQASRVLNLIEDIQLRRCIRSDYFSTYIRKHHDWYHRIHYNNPLISMMTSGPYEQTFLRFMNRLAKVDCSPDDVTYGEFNQNRVVIIDSIANKIRFWENIPVEINVDKIRQDCFAFTNKNVEVKMLWDEYQQFADVRCVYQPLDNEQKIAELMQGDDFCLLQVTYRSYMDYSLFDFKNNRFITGDAIDALISSPKLLSKILGSCFDFLEFIKRHPELVEKVMAMVLNDRDLYGQVFHGQGVIEKMPASDLLEKAGEILKPYQPQIELEELFWKNDTNPGLETLFGILQTAILQLNQPLIARTIKEFQHILSIVRYNEAVFRLFKYINSEINNIKIKVASESEPFNALGNKQAATEMLDNFILAITRIQSQFKISNLRLLSLYALPSNNLTELRNNLYDPAISSMIQEEESKHDVTELMNEIEQEQNHKVRWAN